MNKFLKSTEEKEILDNYLKQYLLNNMNIFTEVTSVETKGSIVNTLKVEVYINEDVITSDSVIINL